MFGQDDNQQQSDQNWQQPAGPVQPAQITGADMPQDNNSTIPSAEPVTAVADPVAAPVQNDWQTPAQPATSDWTAPAAASTVLDEPQHSSADATDDLMAIKQKALTELSPLVGHLDQSPEEKFKTTMMMIQASDDQSLIPEAYSAAQAITDEKAKAQALLDIVNEINYFTQHQD